MEDRALGILFINRIKHRDKKVGNTKVKTGETKDTVWISNQPWKRGDKIGQRQYLKRQTKSFLGWMKETYLQIQE